MTREAGGRDTMYIYSLTVGRECGNSREYDNLGLASPGKTMVGRLHAATGQGFDARGSLSRKPGKRACRIYSISPWSHPTVVGAGALG